jgi:hypothetical protein
VGNIDSSHALLFGHEIYQLLGSVLGDPPPPS